MTIQSVIATASLDLFSETVKGVAERGIDELSISRICQTTGISRPTFYSRFGNIDGLFAEIFLAERERIFDALTAPQCDTSTHLVGLSAMIASSRRKPELFEVVSVEAQRWWDNQPVNELGPVSWLVANRLGVLLTSHLAPEVQATLKLEPFFFALQSQASTPPPQSAQAILNLGPVLLDDPVLDAAMGTVAYAGYAGTSMSRIGRAIRMTTGALYPRYENSNVLLSEVYRRAQAQIVETNQQLWRNLEFTIESFGQFLTEGLKPERNRWRALRLETLLAGKEFREVRDISRLAILQTAKDLGPVIEDAQIPIPAREAVSYVFHTLGVGFGVMKDLGLPVEEINHVHVAAGIAALFRQPLD
jgi:AcrR family transcriptional regulator